METFSLKKIDTRKKDSTRDKEVLARVYERDKDLFSDDKDSSRRKQVVVTSSTFYS